MTLKHFKQFLFLVLISQVVLSCGSFSNRNNVPSIMLWAWERNEDLRFTQSSKIGVAFLAQTIYLTDEDVILKPRRQPLKVFPETHLIAVTRIETRRAKSKFTQTQIDETARLIINSSQPENIRGIQIDFDVKVSERNFYRKLIERVRNEIADEKSFTITALASFCVGDEWMRDLPVDEAVPMLFEMGKDKNEIISFLKGRSDFNETLCQKSYGLLLNEKLKIELKKDRTRYYFNYRSWKKEDLEKLK